MIKLTHVRLCVRQFGACHRFYRDVLEFSPRFAPEGDTVYEEFSTGGGTTLAIFSRALMANVLGTSGKPAVVNAQDAVVLCLAVDDVDAAAAGLRAKGVKLDREPHDQPEWGVRVAHFRDPDGNLLEISADLAKNYV